MDVLLPLVLQKAYYFGLAEAFIHANFADPDFTDCAARDRSDQEDVNTYFGSREFERLDTLLGGLLSRWETVSKLSMHWPVCACMRTSSPHCAQCNCLAHMYAGEPL